MSVLILCSLDSDQEKGHVLVPTLCVGTLLRDALRRGRGRGASWNDVPTQSVGTRQGGGGGFCLKNLSGFK